MKQKKIIFTLLFVICALLISSCSDKKTGPTVHTATVIINLVANNGASLSGALVVLQKHSGSAYQLIATSNNVIFTNIPWGNYSVIVSHANYAAIIMESFVVQTDTASCTVNLESTALNIGDLITFGAYQWQVLDIKEGKALLITKNIIEQRQYHASNTSVTWSNCDLRSYLNNAFLNSSAFSNTDRTRITLVTNTNENNQWYGTSGGGNTNDRIFLLSLAEVVQYFGDSGQLAHRPSGSSYDINDQYNGNRVATFNGTAVKWWLRSPGDVTNYAATVSSNGNIYVDGRFVGDYDGGGVRPALWLNL